MQIRATLTLTSPILLNPRALKDALAGVVKTTTLEVETGIKVRMRQPKTGRTYRRGAITRRASKRSRSLGLRERTTRGGQRLAIVGAKIHRASAPGEAPAVDLGALVNSFVTRIEGLHGRITSPLAKALLLETGTARIAARPSVGPAVEAAREGFEQAVDQAVRELL